MSLLSICLIILPLKHAGNNFSYANPQVRRALSAYRNALATYAGDDVDALGLAMFGSSEELPGGDLSLPDSGGLDSLIGALDAELPPFAVRKNHVVERIDYSGDTAKLLAKVKGETEPIEFEADHVICTIPIGVLKKHHKTLFNPGLHEDRVGFSY